jgi:hypothetical protein
VCCCCSFLTLIAPVPAIAGIVLGAMSLAGSEDCGPPIAAWLIVQSVVMLLHLSFGCYLCRVFSRPYDGPVSEDAAASGYGTDQTNDFGSRVLFTICEDGVTATYLCVGGVFGFVWLVFGGVWGGDAGVCSPETVTAMNWLVVVGYLAIFGGSTVFCCSIGCRVADTLAEVLLADCCPCLAPFFCLCFGPHVVANAEQRRRIRADVASGREHAGRHPTGGGIPAPHRSRATHFGHHGAATPAGDAFGGRATGSVATGTSATASLSSLPPHKRAAAARQAPSSVAPSTPGHGVRDHVEPHYAVPSGPGLPRTAPGGGGAVAAGDASLPPHKRGAAVAARPAAPAPGGADAAVRGGDGAGGGGGVSGLAYAVGGVVGGVAGRIGGLFSQRAAADSEPKSPGL